MRRRPAIRRAVEEERPTAEAATATAVQTAVPMVAPRVVPTMAPGVVAPRVRQAKDPVRDPPVGNLNDPGAPGRVQEQEQDPAAAPAPAPGVAVSPRGPRRQVRRTWHHRPWSWNRRPGASAPTMGAETRVELGHLRSPLYLRSSLRCLRSPWAQPWDRFSWGLWSRSFWEPAHGPRCGSALRDCCSAGSEVVWSRRRTRRARRISWTVCARRWGSRCRE